VSLRLSEIEDRLLAIADEEPYQLSEAKDILTSWFGREISAGEIVVALERVAGLGLAEVLASGISLVQVGDLSSAESKNVSYRATAEGIAYLTNVEGPGA
jgi:hypothetical protein